jgi:predicted TIM-barrel fold metal-dependent hydrolase
MPLSHPDFCPIYAEAERQDLAIAVHLGRGSPGINRLFDGLPRPPDEPSHLPPRAGAIVSGLLVEYGFYSILQVDLPSQFPRLRWVFLEAGAAWAVPALTTLGRGTDGTCWRHVAEGRIFLSCEPDEDLPYVASRLGDDCLVVASDMPHGDPSRHDMVEAAFRERGDLAESFLDRVLCDNPRRLYSFT